MSDDTTTWLKKNPAINPLRRSLKTTLRFYVPNADMNASIISNPDKVKDQGLFIPRMLQKSNMQLRKSRAHEFKVPVIIPAKPVTKKKEIGSSGSGVHTKKVPASTQSSKSLLPIAKSKVQPPEKSSSQSSFPRSSFLPGASGRRTMVRREMIKKLVELSGVKKPQEVESEQKLVTLENSVLRSILKKREASLRRTSQTLNSKPKAKKVLFDGLENSFVDDKENEANLFFAENQIQKELINDFTALDEPTVFLNLKNVDVSSSEETKKDLPPLNWSVEACEGEERTDSTSLSDLMKRWNSYRENLDNLRTARDSLEDSFESFLEQGLKIKKRYDEYRKNSDEIYDRLSKLGKELEESLRKTLEGGETEETPKNERLSTGRKFPEKSNKIRMSNKSKGIKKNSGKKTLKKDLLRDMEGSFSLVSKKTL